jgi:hypothetical protein
VCVCCDLLYCYAVEEFLCQLSEDGDIILSKHLAAVYKIVHKNYRILRLLVLQEIHGSVKFIW